MQQRKKRSSRSSRLSVRATAGWAFLPLSFEGQVLDAHTLELTEGKRLHADHFILATGSQIAMPPIAGLDQVTFKTSDDVLELSEIPEEVVVLGGGIVACELAQF